MTGSEVAVTRCPQLAPDDAWRCPHCKVPQQGTVKLSLWTLPDILIIHLKRFRQVAEQRHKLTTLVRFPLRGLDMAPHVAQRGQPGGQLLGRWAPWQPPLRLPPACPRDHLYDLYAVCNHHGSMQGGHYTGERGHRGQGCAMGVPWGGQRGAGVHCSHPRAHRAPGCAPQHHPTAPGCPCTVRLLLFPWLGASRGGGSVPPHPLPLTPSVLLQRPGRALVQLRRQPCGGGAGGRGEHPQRLHPLLPAPPRRRLRHG